MSDSDDSAKSATSRNGGHVTMRRAQRVKDSPVHGGVPSDMQKINLKVPSFSPDDPEIWFALLEAQFDSYNVTNDQQKFTNVITNLDLHHAKAVKDIIINPPVRNRYEKLKSELIRRLSASHERKVKQLLTHEELGDRKPSQFLRHLQDLAGPSVPEDFIRTIWSNRLPHNIQTVLASQPSHSLEQLSDLADRIQELTSPLYVASTSSGASASYNPLSEISELRKMVEHLSRKLDDYTRTSCRPKDRSRASRQRSSSRHRTRSQSSHRKYPVCWYHAKFGSKALKCIKPCDFKQAENFMGGR